MQEISPLFVYQNFLVPKNSNCELQPFQNQNSLHINNIMRVSTFAIIAISASSVVEAGNLRGARRLDLDASQQVQVDLIESVEG